MTLSLNEIEATAKKAARGAGYSWGIAEEAARAARFLCAHGLDGCNALAGLLTDTDGHEPAGRAPQALSDNWQSASGHICALMAGAALSDSARKLRKDAIHINSVSYPVVLIAFAATAARQLHKTITVTWPGATVSTDGQDIDVTPGSQALMAPYTDHVRVAVGGAVKNCAPAVTRASPQDQDLATLTTFANRTYAPATEESRILGAGAGTSDND